MNAPLWTTPLPLLLAAALAPAPASGDVKAPRAPRSPKPDAALAGPVAPSAAAPARAATPTSAPQLLEVLWDEPGDGALWVRGTDYKARIDARGLEFHPFLGSDAPRNFPVALALTGVAVDGAPLPLAPATWSRAGDEVTVNRGSVLERYRVGLDSVEQVFEIVGPAAGSVELTVAVETELTGRAAGAGFEFGGERGGVRYGEASAVLPGGRAPVATALGSDRLTIRVPESVTALAGGRLIVDPIVSTFNVYVGSGETVLNPDVTWSPSVTGTGYLRVWEQAFSLTDSDVYLQFTGGPIGVDITADSWNEPTLASSTRTLVVASELDGAGVRKIAGRTFLPSLLAQPQFDALVDTAKNRDLVRPDLGVDDFPGRTGAFLLVCERQYSSDDGDVLARLFTGLGVANGTFWALDESSEDDRRPSVSSSLGRASEGWWNVVWDREFGPGDRDIMKTRVRYNGSWFVPSVLDGSADDQWEAVASPPLPDNGSREARRWMAAYRWTPSLSPTTRLRGVSVLVGSALSYVDLTAALGASMTEDYDDVALASNDCSFGVAWSQSFLNSSSDWDVWMAALAPLGTDLAVVEPPVPAAFTNSFEFQPGLAGRPPGPGAAADFEVVWTDNASSSAWDLLGAAYDLPASPTCLGTTVCIGQNNETFFPAAMRAFGSPVVADNDVTFDVFGLSKNKVGYLLLSPNANLIPVGQGTLCVGPPTIRMKALQQFSGPLGLATFQPDLLNLPFGFTLVPGTPYYFQYWYRDTLQATGLPTTNFSEALQIVFQ